MLGLNYMAWIGIVSWIGVPLLAFFTTRLLWRRSPSNLSKLWALVAGVVILFTPALISNGVKAYYDRQVQELCAKDGGVRVYETVRLPAERFNQWGQPNFYHPDQGKSALGSDFLIEKERHYYKFGNPEMTRTWYRVIRQVDGKLLGEEVFYGRVGGDVPGPWHHSSFHCPSDYGDIPLLVKIFIKSSEE